MSKKELKKWIRTATQEQIIEYWKIFLAPRYGYKQLIDTDTGKVLAEVK